MARWSKFPGDGGTFNYAGDALKKAWPKLHRADAEPWPKDPALQEAWRLFHAGQFQAAAQAGLALGSAGWAVANLATSIHANYLEKKETEQIALFKEVMARAEAHQRDEPVNPAGYYHYAYAAGRYSQRISVVKALAEGYGGKIRAALETTLKLAPRHAHAHSAMGAYHAEIISKVGAMVGGLTYGAKKDLAEKHYAEALKLAPDCAIAMTEYANGLLLLYGDKKMEAATDLYVKAAELTPLDAMEWLDIEAAKAELEDE
jgi:tetratricopeptide (TPR) repeat protein